MYSSKLFKTKELIQNLLSTVLKKARIKPHSQSKILLFIIKNKIDIILIFILLILVFRAWFAISDFTVRSDGLLSMTESSQKHFWGYKYAVASIVLSEMVVGGILGKIFTINFSYYYWLEVFVIMLLAVLFYWTVKVITKNYLVSFAASLISAVSYFGVYDMVSTHCYCFFLERVIPMIFLIPSFPLLHLFLETNKKNYLVCSVLLYFLGVGFGHFVVLFTPAYFLYPVFWKFFNKRTLREWAKGLIVGAVYVLISAFFLGIQQVNESGLRPHNWTFIQFLLDPHKYEYVKKIAVQYVYWSQYPVFVGLELSNNPTTRIIDYRSAPSYIPFTIVVYIFAALVIYKLLPKQRALLITTSIAVPVIFYLNAYIGQYEMLHFSGASRYLYIPTFLLAIFWSYFLWAVFWRKKNIFAFGGLLVLALYYMINSWLITGNAVLAVKWNRSARTIFEYVVSTRSKIPPNTLVLVTYPEFGIQESTFFTEQIGKNEVRYISDNNLVNPVKWQDIASSSAHLITLRYDETCECVREEKIK